MPPSVKLINKLKLVTTDKKDCPSKATSQTKFPLKKGEGPPESERILTKLTPLDLVCQRTLL